jgi:hypothetical protein
MDAQQEYRCTNAAGVSNRVCMCAVTADCPEMLPNCCDDGTGAMRCYDAAGAVDRTCL